MSSCCRYSTISWAIVHGCSAQMYSYVPGVAMVTVTEDPAFDPTDPPRSVAGLDVRAIVLTLVKVIGVPLLIRARPTPSLHTVRCPRTAATAWTSPTPFLCGSPDCLFCGLRVPCGSKIELESELDQPRLQDRRRPLPRRSER